MEQTQIEIENCLIAEFMGLKYSQTYQRYDDFWGEWHNEEDGVWYDKIVTDNDLHYCRLNKDEYVENHQYSLKYHTEWNWLMPVVEKIESLGWDSKICGNDSDGGYLCDFVNGLNEEAACAVAWKEHGDTKIKAVWLAVVEFIKWHNAN